MIGWVVRSNGPGQTRVGTSPKSDTLDQAVDRAIDLERQKHTIEGIDGPNGETYDRDCYAELRRKKQTGKP